MRILPYKLQTMSYVINHVSKTIHGDESPFEMISEAPLWLRLLSRGRYCAYGSTIYVPAFHLELVSSQYDADRTLATAKLLPWVMLLHDAPGGKIPFLLTLTSLFSVSYQIHYFLYEFLFLKATNHKFYDVISVGFMTTRRSWLGIKKLAYESVQSHMQAILEKSKPV